MTVLSCEDGTNKNPLNTLLTFSICSHTPADPNAKCQKCLQKGHWTSDCKGERVYISRPFRTALLKNPSLRLPEQLKAQNELEDLEKERERAAAEILAQSEAFNKPDPGVASVYDDEEDSLSSTTDDDYDDSALKPSVCSKEHELSWNITTTYSRDRDQENHRDPRPRSRSPQTRRSPRRHRDDSSSGYTSDSE